MPTKPVSLFGDPVLRTPANAVTDFDEELRTLVHDLWDTMEARGAAGLAAPQLGIGLRVFTYHCDGFGGHLVNPCVRVLDERERLGPEGCLSIPGRPIVGSSWNCHRYRRVVARGWNMHGEPVEVEGSELLARCVQHETDHLDGVLFVDRLDDRDRERALREVRTASGSDGVEPMIQNPPIPREH